MATMLHADNKRNIIIDTIKIDGYYYDVMLSSTKMKTAIKFDGTTNNTTLNNVQIYNTSMYGMYLGLGSSYNTIMNTQAFNNAIAGIYLYYSSNYNVINNTQTYNNGLYGIWLAN
jgi:parallel beta-helix repeat protein